MDAENFSIFEIMSKAHDKISADAKKLTPVWHETVDAIDFDLQPDNEFSAPYNTRDFQIYKSPLADLIKALAPIYRQVYAKPTLFNTQHDKDKLIGVVDCWKNGEALIPPMLMDAGNNELLPLDGKHRLKVACFNGVEEVYFILFDADMPRITQYFNPTSVH